ncbi:MAG: hypothetical protein ABI362_01625 [Chthoniobacterales bacterium]
MLHHLQQILSHCSVAVQYLWSCCHAGSRVFFLTLSQGEAPRDAFRIARRQVGSSRRFSKFGDARHRPPLLVHYHIFKNAGTSFEWALEQALGNDLMRFDKSECHGFVSARELATIARQHPSIKAISTHQAAPPAPTIRGRDVLTSILLRDPIARVRSIYAFEQRQEQTSEGPIKAKELDFQGYIEWCLKARPRMFCDFQFHFLRRYATHHEPLLNESELRKSIAALDAIHIVGTVERYDEWLGLAESVLSRKFGKLKLQPVRLNSKDAVQPESQEEIYHDLIVELGLDLAQELLERNQFDMRLHQVSDAILSRRLAEEGAEVRLRRAYVEAHRSPLAPPLVG